MSKEINIKEIQIARLQLVAKRLQKDNREITLNEALELHAEMLLLMQILGITNLAENSH